MNTDQNRFEKKLQQEREVLVGELDSVGVMTHKKTDEWSATPTESDGELADANEAADRIESFEENSALVSELETRLREVDHALKNIKQGTFGLCEVCKAPIEEDRLNANPAARTCKTHIETKLGIPDIS